jgi:multidrug efflux pump subunit AcrA (membrane-fusion protein)
VVLGIFTEIKPNEKVADKDVIVVGKQKYRRLREGDEVMEGQLVARVNDAAAADEVAIREAKLQGAKAELVTATATRDESKQRYERMVRANMGATPTFSNEEINGAKLTWERYVQEEMVKKANVVLEERQLLAAKRIQQQYEIRSPVHGVVKVIHVQKGEAVKKLETVVEILPLDEK